MSAPTAAPEPVAGDPRTPWSGTVRRTAEGSIEVGGLDVRDIAVEHGTPVYVLDEADLRRRARAFVTAFTSAFADLAGADVYFASKSFASVAVDRWVHEEGMHVDVSTGGELAVALRAGVPGDAIALHGNNKSTAELERALRAGVGRIVVDSLGEIEHLAHLAGALGLPAPVMIRVTTGVHAGGHDFISTAHEDQKFGLSLASGAARAAVDAVLARPELTLLGLHSHIGSQILDLAGFEVAAGALLTLRAEVAADTGTLMPELDLGGGYGISYTGADVPPTPEEIAPALAAVVRRACEELGSAPPRVSVEPGRAVVGPAGLTLYRVGTVKPVVLDDGSARRYVSVDGGMSDNIRTALYDAEYTATVAGRRSEAPTVLSRVVGKHCESGDIVVRDVLLPDDVAPGDLLAVPATGAYGRSMASNYNLLPRPGVLAVREGRARFIVRPETEEDLLALDLG
ncbi:diaminopimelate decarboxylase [Georgenia sp. H159]|uniref:diaminopimelate decarboxylase n=1 Tax=Georgenia sp. H159 TaxID=3076115 RepID=UPI002D76DA8F|nr:diaminopimelate decarboxylase [Georgenia sp. H159]